ncbi:MAG: hypothetical protein V1838_00430 [Patescibacteria group bacterium]
MTKAGVKIMLIHGKCRCQVSNGNPSGEPRCPKCNIVVRDDDVIGIPWTTENWLKHRHSGDPEEILSMV